MAVVGLVYNANAGGSLSRNDYEIYRDLVEKRNGLFRSPLNADVGLDNVVKEFYEKNLQVVVSWGWDGTFHSLLTSYVKNSEGRALPKFVILRAGTMNILATAIGCKEKPEKDLDVILDADINSLKIKRVRTLDLDSDGTRYAGVVFAGGSIYNFVKEHADPSSGGKSVAKAIRMVARGVTNGTYRDSIIKPTEANLYVDRNFRCNKYTAILVCGFKPNILGAKPFNWMDDTDGLYEGDIALQGLKLVFASRNAYAGKKMKEGNYSSGAKEFRISAHTSFGYTLDGELFTAKDVTIKEGPTIELVVL